MTTQRTYYDPDYAFYHYSPSKNESQGFLKSFQKKHKGPIICTLIILLLILVFIITFVFTINSISTDRTKKINVIQHNIEYGAEGYSLHSLTDMFRGNDVILIQEAWTENGTDSSIEIASILGMNQMSFPFSSTAILARWNMNLINNMNRSALVRVEGPDPFYVLVLHLDDWYYQPFQAQEIPYEREGIFQPNTTNATELIEYAISARGNDVMEIVQRLNELPSNAHVIVGGDFNEPSHLDWTERNCKVGFCPVSVAYPASQLIKNTSLGMKDCYRTLYPNEVSDPGITWPDRVIDYQFRPDRIDMMFVDKRSMVLSINIINGTKSDHKALKVVIEFN